MRYEGDFRDRRRLKAAVLAVGLLLALRASADAHDGPPYPLFVDKNAGPYVVSVWADPDVGVGTFFFVVEPAQGGASADDLAVEVCLRPVSGRLDEECYAARRDGVRGRAQFSAEARFDRQEFWHARVVLRGSLGEGSADADVEATPPGLGRWDLLLYLSPFAAVGFLWLRATLRARSLEANARAVSKADAAPADVAD